MAPLAKKVEPQLDEPARADAPVPVELWDAQTWDEWEGEMYRRGGERIRESIKDLKARGILDEDGERVRKDLPAAMLAGDKLNDIP